MAYLIHNTPAVLRGFWVVSLARQQRYSPSRLWREVPSAHRLRLSNLLLCRRMKDLAVCLHQSLLEEETTHIHVVRTNLLHILPILNDLIVQRPN